MAEQKIVIYDFEVFKFDWSVEIFEVNTQSWVSIENNREELIKYVDENMDTIWIGFNSKNYDTHILKAVYAGFDPYSMSDWIINQKQSPYMYPGFKQHYFLPIKGFDLKNDAIKRYNFALSLKEYEANCGVDIHESSIPFDIDRKLTPEELKENQAYCRADVMNTYMMFKEPSQQDVILSQISLCSLVDQPLHKVLHKPVAQLAAVVLGATRHNYHDENRIELPEMLQLKDTRIIDFFSQELDEKMSLEVELDGVKYKFGLGGLHSAIPNYVSDERHLHIDVTSYYPSLIIQHNLGARTMVDPTIYERIYNERLAMKKAGNPMQATYKLVLNIKYGAMDSEFNALYDPKNRRKIAAWGQMFLFDLVEKIAPYGKIVQTNTDGIIMLPNEGQEDKIREIVSEWENRTKMNMEYDEISRIVQKDVNNYVFKFTNGKWELKGGMVKYGGSTTNYKRSMTILDKATAAYLVEGTPIEETIMGGEDILDYQYIAKATHLYPKVYHEVNGEKVITQRVNRLFPTTDTDYGQLEKFRVFKGKDSYTKFINAPEHALVINQDIRGIKDTKQFFSDIELDYSWYIKQVRSRLDKYLGNGKEVPWAK